MGQARRNVPSKKGQAIAPRYRMGGIQPTNFQTTAPVASTCCPSAIAVQGPPCALPQRLFKEPELQYIYRARPVVSAPMPHGRYTEHTLPNYSASSNYLPSKRRSPYRVLRTSFPHRLFGAPKAQFIYWARPSACAPCRTGGIRSIRFQTTAPVAITCFPNAIAGTGSSVRPSRSGISGTPRCNISTESGQSLSPPLPHGRYTERPIPNYSASSNYFPPKRHSRYRLLRTSFPRRLFGVPQARFI